MDNSVTFFQKLKKHKKDIGLCVAGVLLFGLSVFLGVRYYLDSDFLTLGLCYGPLVIGIGMLGFGIHNSTVSGAVFTVLGAASLFFFTRLAGVMDKNALDKALIPIIVIEVLSAMMLAGGLIMLCFTIRNSTIPGAAAVVIGAGFFIAGLVMGITTITVFGGIIFAAGAVMLPLGIVKYVKEAA